MDDNFILIKEIVINDPPTRYDVPYKKPKFDKNGKPVDKITFYLTGNLFYADSGSIFTVRKIIQETKEFLFKYLKGIPKLDKMRLEFEYHSLKHIDLDNKFSYWGKVFLDVLKTPTEIQINKALKYKKPIITTRTISDDNTKCIDEIKMKWFHGEHKMVFRIYGRYASEQKEILFDN